MAALPLTDGWGQGSHDLSAELEISRSVQSNELVPVVGEYVRYDATMKNTGALAIHDQILWVHFVSDNGKTDSKTTFSIPTLAPGASTELHLGPFKMLESGNHCLVVGVNREGKIGTPNQVSLNYSTAQCADSFFVYMPMVAIFLPVGIGVAAAGAIFIVWRLKRARS